MNWQSIQEGITTFLVLFVIAFLIYTAIKKQSLKDTWEEITELFSTPKEVVEEVGGYY